MNIRKSLGPGIETFGGSALIGYSCEDFLSRTTGIHLRIPACQILSKALDISHATVAPERLQALSNLPGTTIKRPAVYQEDLKSI